MSNGILGLGFGVGFNQNYSTVLDEMYDQGMILDKDYSLALGSIDKENGEFNILTIKGECNRGLFTWPLFSPSSSNSHSPLAPSEPNITGK